MNISASPDRDLLGQIGRDLLGQIGRDLLGQIGRDLHGQIGRDLHGQITSFIGPNDLARLARTCKTMAAAVQAEMIGRIGPRNYRAITGPDPITPNDLSAAVFEVTDPAMFVPVVTNMLGRVDADDWFYEDGECQFWGIDNLLSYWIHFGLPGCARILLNSLDSQIVYWRKPKKYSSTTCCPAEIQECIFWDAVRCMYDNTGNIRDYLDKLDGPNFNLFIDVARKYTVVNWFIENVVPRANVRAVFEDRDAAVDAVIKSNDAWPRYDPNFISILDPLHTVLVPGPPTPADVGPTCNCERPPKAHRHLGQDTS